MTHSHAAGDSPGAQPCSSILSLLSLPSSSTSTPLAVSAHSPPAPDYCDVKEGRGTVPEGAVGSWRSRSVALQTLTKYASEELCLFVVVPLGCCETPCPMSDQVAWWKKTAHIDCWGPRAEAAGHVDM